jgi:ribosomal protein L31
LCKPLYLHSLKKHGKIREQKINIMKQGIHPESYRLVVFKDMSNGTSFLSKSTAFSKETITWEDGNEYPVIKLEISKYFSSFLHR